MSDMPSYSYRYSVVRYVHDRRTEEFVNIGVVLECVALGYLGCKFDSGFSRVAKFFPGVKVHQLRGSLRRMNFAIEEKSESLRRGGEDMFPRGRGYLEQIWREILPRDDTSIAWSELKGGIADLPEVELERIFEKMVLQYKDDSLEKASRSDADVWGVVEKHLVAKSLRPLIVEHLVKSRVSEYRFSHSIKNGVWHCIEPVSIDLVKTESIRSKVQKIFGAMSLIKASALDINVHFVLSSPTTVAAKEMFQEATGVVSSVEVPHEVLMEDESPQLAERLAAAVFH